MALIGLRRSDLSHQAPAAACPPTQATRCPHPRSNRPPLCCRQTSGPWSFRKSITRCRAEKQATSCLPAADLDLGIEQPIFREAARRCSSCRIAASAAEGGDSRHQTGDSGAVGEEAGAGVRECCCSSKIKTTTARSSERATTLRRIKCRAKRRRRQDFSLHAPTVRGTSPAHPKKSRLNLTKRMRAQES